MKGKHFAIKEKNKKRTKSIVLSIVAVLELVLLITSFTFSWFEGLTSLELTGNDFSAAAALNSHLMLGENENDEDDTYSEIIDLTSFFDAQREVRLSPVSSADAKNFYAAYDGVPNKDNYGDLHYRKLSKEDTNSNIIQFEFNLSSPHGNTDVYLTELLPAVYINGTPYYCYDEDDLTNYNSGFTFPYRFAFSDGTTTVIMKNSTSLNTADGETASSQIAVSSINSDGKASFVTGTVGRSQEYAYYPDHSNTVMAPDDTGFGEEVSTKPLFSIGKNETKTITVSVWLEAMDYECLNNTTYKPVPGDSISFSVQLCTSWSITRDITVYDYTAEQWIDTDNKQNQETALFVRNADGADNGYHYRLDYDADNHKWTGKIPIGLNNCEFLWGNIDSTNGKCITTNETCNRFQAPNRNDSTVITILGLGSSCVWDLTPDQLEKIDFRDYTSTSWIATKDGKGNRISMNVNIIYDGRTLDYSMSDDPTQDSYGKNSWSCWIPKDVNSVDFSRRGYNNANNLIEFNIWHGTDRNNKTVYRALTGDSGTVDNSKFYLYVKIDDAIADTFYSNNKGRSPAISFTGNANRILWETTTDKTKISRYDFKPSLDTWPNGESELTRIGNSNTWYMAFEQKPADGTYVTVWSRSGANNFNDIDTEMSFGVFYLFDASKNYTTINLTTAQQLVSAEANNNYILLGTMDSSGTGAGGYINSEGNIGTGVWGEMTAPPESTWTNPATFIHTSNVDSVKVIFTYGGVEFKMDMEKDTTDPTGRTWNTKAIPDTITTGISFEDSNGNVWTDTGSTRTNAKHYYYAKTTNGTSSTGTGWRRVLSPEGDRTFFFKHYDSSTTNVKAVTVSYLYEGVPFSFSLTRGSDNKTWSTKNIPEGATSVKYSDGTRTWSITDFSSSNTYCYALDNNQYLLRNSANYARIYLERNYTWTDIKIYYTGTGGGDWDNRPAMIDLGRKYNGSPLYCYLVPTNAGLIVFTGTEGSDLKQTEDIKSYHTTDMRKFKFQSWDSSQNKAKCSNTTISASSLK